MIVQNCSLFYLSINPNSFNSDDGDGLINPSLFNSEKPSLQPRLTTYGEPAGHSSVSIIQLIIGFIFCLEIKYVRTIREYLIQQSFSKIELENTHFINTTEY